MSIAHAVSSDGSTIVGVSQSANGGQRAFRWTASSGMVDIGTLGGTWAAANGVSGDGLVVCGASAFATGSGAFRWSLSAGMEYLGGFDATGLAVSRDGRVVVGYSAVSPNVPGIRAVLSVPGQGMRDLGLLQGTTSASALAASATGSVIVGRTGGIAFVWQPVTGMLDASALFVSSGANTLGWSLESCTGVSDSGSVMVGIGDQHGVRRAWIVTGLPTACAADFDRDGTVAVQDVFAYLNAWFGMDQRADLDLNGLSVTDIFGFLNTWFPGCS